jgi:histidinol-phosphate aminotransferase
MVVESLLSAHVQDLAAYEPPDWQALAASAGTSPETLIRLDANENAYGPPRAALEALARHGGYGYYPDYGPLQGALARYAGVAPQSVVLANGGDETIDLAVRAFVEPGEAAIVCPPAFSMYAIDVRAHRGRVLSVPRRDDWLPDVAAIEALVQQQAAAGPRPKLLFLTSPGNPDGQAIPLEMVRRLLALPLAVAVDEAYVEFGGRSVAPLLAEFDNLVVLRTFSKWAGLAGLRLGYVLAAPPVIEAMQRLRPPYNVNAAVAVAALAILEDPAEAQATIARIVAERERLVAALAALPGVEPLAGQANFCFFRVAGRSGPELAAALAARRVLVRSFGGDEKAGGGPSLADAIRVTVGRPEQNDAFLAALRAILGIEPPGADTQSPAVSAGRLSGQPRRATVRRATGETDVTVSLDLDGGGRCRAETGLGFFDHMLAQVAAHGLFDLEVQARGDLEVDGHHTVEDVAITLGQALDRALGKRRGLARMGHTYAPLDEALARVVVDLSGRPYAVVDAHFDAAFIGALEADLVVHFFETLAVHGRLALHAQVLYGRNDHHRAEALFKALGRALAAASRLDPRRQGVPSTKGVL